MACGMTQNERENFKALAIAVVEQQRMLAAEIEKKILLQREVESYREFLEYVKEGFDDSRP